MPEYWNPEGGEFKMKGFPYPGKSPVKKHDGTTSTTTHYADGSPKSKREVEFSKRHEEELRKEKLLNQGFTPEDADKMIKTGATTGEVDPDAPGTPGTPGYEPPVRRSDLDKKGKAIWDAHRAKKKSPAKQGIYTKEGDKKVKAAKKKYIGESKELKKSNIALLKKAKKEGYKEAKEDIKTERKRHKTTKKAIKKGYKQAKRKAKTTEPKTYTGSVTGDSA